MPGLLGPECDSPARHKKGCDARKNPKQRELKGRFAMTKMFCVSTLKAFEGCYISD